MKTFRFISMALTALVLMAGATGAFAGVQYSNDFENPSSEDVTEAYPEWIKFADGSDCHAINGRLEWYGSGGNDDWIRLEKELPMEYTVELDFFTQEGINGRFSIFPIAQPEESIFDRHHYFIRKNTHYFNFADTIPSEGPFDASLPIGSSPHRFRFEVAGDHIAFLYKDRGEGGWILVDERDFPPFPEAPRFFQLGYNHDGGSAGLHWVDNLVISYREQNIFSYKNNFDTPSAEDVQEAYPEWIKFADGSDAHAVNGRLEWYGSGGNDDWIRLDREVPMNFVMELDFFTQEGINGRFSIFPLALPGESIFDRHHYFVRKNTHYFNFADTIPSEGPFDATLPVGSSPHRFRFEVTGDHIVFLYKDRGEGGWILVDERDFPPFPDGPRYVQLGYNHDGGSAGLHWVDNLEIFGLAENRAVVERAIGAQNFEADTPVPVGLRVSVTGAIPSLTVTEGFPEGWLVEDISHGGVRVDGNIIWSITNLGETIDLTYKARPPRLIRARVAGFSGSADSGDGEERVAGDTAIAMLLPYLYRESIDYDFSGSPVDGKNYPIGHAYGERYAQGMDGIPSDTPYERPGDGSIPAVGTEFVFPAGDDFFMGNPTGGRGGTYTFDDYRDQEEIVFEHGASDTNAGVGSDNLGAGDWVRYTFDLGEGNQVLLLNLSANTWGAGDCPIDIYADNKYVGEILAPNSAPNEYNFYTIGPFETSGGVHSIVIAFPGANVPDGIGRLEVVKVSGIGAVTRKLTEDGFFDPSQPLKVSLTAEALYGSYSAFIDERMPPGFVATDITDGGQQIGDHIIWELSATDTSTTVGYTLQPSEGTKFLLFSGLCDVGLPLAKPIRGDVSVTNELWLFGEPDADSKVDGFDGSALVDPWFIEYGSDPALATDYTSGVRVDVADGKLRLEADPGGEAGLFDEWTNGRRAPMILRTDVPAGDWRIEAELTLADAYIWTEFHTGIAVTYNQGDDTDVSGDEYLFGFYGNEIRAELTDGGSMGSLQYHSLSDEFDWIDLLLAGDVTAAIAVTKRGDSLIFSAKLPGRPWQLAGPPTLETRTATRIGLFTKIWGTENFAITEFDKFTLSPLTEFTAVSLWELY